MKISLLLPTRQRPEQFIRFCNSALAEAEHPDQVEIIAYVDNDDNSYDDLKLPNLKIIRGPRVVLSEMWNACWKEATGEIFGHMGDDIIFRTKGWDDTVRFLFASYDDRIVFVYGEDGNGESERNQFGTHGFIHKNWTDTVGYFVPPYYVSDYNDTHLNDIAKALKRHVHIDIMTEHMHFSLGKSEIDQNTRDRLARHEKEKPEEIYYSKEKRHERLMDTEKLRTFINEYKS